MLQGKGAVMSTSWLRWALAAAMIAVVVYHLARLAESRLGRHPARFDVELTHAAMGVVMTVMLVGSLAASDGRRLAMLFAAPLVWFIWRGMHSYVMDGPRAVGMPARQVIGCAAMVYMLIALTGASSAATAVSGMSMPATASPVPSPLLAGLLAVATLGVAGWTVMRARTTGASVRPALTVGCQLAMNATTVYMLVAM
jgi:Domain of unknown function (DUF5134)